MKRVGCNEVSMAQAIYHGKPIVGMPFQGDQPSNADRVVAKASMQRLSCCRAAARCIRCGAAGVPALRLLLSRCLLRNLYARQPSARHDSVPSWVFTQSEGGGWLVTQRTACAGRLLVSLLQAG